MNNEEIFFVKSETEEIQDLPFYITMSGISYPDASYKIIRNNSSVACFEYILDGTGTVSDGTHTCRPEKDDVYMLLLGRNHNYFSDSECPWTKIWFNAGGRLIESMINAYGLDGKILVKSTGAYKYFAEMLELCKSRSSKSDINEKAAIIFHKLICHLYSISSPNDNALSDDAATMKDYLDLHLTENVSTEILASLIYKSKSQAIRIFKASLGTTPYDYLLEKRFLLAKSLLTNTNLLIKEIAFRCGFSDEHYFSDLFKKKFQVTPKEYRRSSLMA